MSLFKDHSNDVKIGKFWYPTNYYDIKKHYLLYQPLKAYMDSRLIGEMYRFLDAVEHIGRNDMIEIYHELVKPDARTPINISGALRAKITDEIEALDNGNRPRVTVPRPVGAPPIANERRELGKIVTRDVIDDVHAKRRELTDLFERARTEVATSFREDHIASTATGFWTSKPFLAVHGSRERNFWKNFALHRKVPVEQIMQLPESQPQRPGQGGRLANLTPAERAELEDAWNNA